MFALTLVAMIAANDIGVEIESVTKKYSMPKVILKVTNDGDSHARHIFIGCVFFDANGKALDLGKEVIRDLSPGEIRYGSVGSSLTTTHSVSCRVDSAR